MNMNSLLSVALQMTEGENNSKGWQCAEFAAQILKRCGLRLPERENLTPIELITLIKQGA